MTKDTASRVVMFLISAKAAILTSNNDSHNEDTVILIDLIDKYAEIRDSKGEN